jgi:endonuclease/exonuclease/phosphatase family metal-dependent hydrolase
MLYWIYSFKKHFWPCLIIIALGYNHINTLVSINLKPNVKPSLFCVTSYNVRLFNIYKWIDKEGVKNEIVNYLNNSNSSILCLQEFYAPNKLPEIDYPYSHIGLQKLRSHWRMATYSKFPIIKKGTVSISGENINNVCIYSDVLLEKDTVRVYNLHLASNVFQKSDYEFIDTPSIEGAENIFRTLKKSFVKRSSQVKSIRDHMEKSPYPYILCGDFNDTPLSFAYKQLSNGLTDAFVHSGAGIGKTYNGQFPAIRIDFILMSSNFKISNFNTSKIELSDHYPITADFY